MHVLYTTHYRAMSHLRTWMVNPVTQMRYSQCLLSHESITLAATTRSSLNFGERLLHGSKSSNAQAVRNELGLLFTEQGASKF
jgi:hypothetical protein